MKNVLLAMVLFVLTAPAGAAIVQFDLTGVAGAGLLPGNEPGSITGGTGGEIGAGITYDNDPGSRQLTVNVGWGSTQGFTDLTSATNNSHIHGPTLLANGDNFTQVAGVIHDLTRSSNLATGGSISQTVTLSAAQEVELFDGKWYINIHTTTNGGGEMRGFLVPVPEPSMLGLFAMGAASLLARRRRD